MKTKLKANEKVFLLVRKHWFTLVGPIFWTLVILFVLVLFYNQNPIYSHYFIIGAAVMIFWPVYKIVDRNTNIWVVTNLRVIDEHGVFSSNSKESPLDKINNVSYRKPFIGRIFNYGHVQIQTAAEMGSTLHTMVERPALLKDTITKSQEGFRQKHIQEQAQNLANAVGVGRTNEASVSEEISKLYDLKEKGAITEEEFQQLKTKILNN